MGNALDTILPAVAAIATTAAGFPEFAPVAAGATSGGVNYSQTHNIGSALKSGALTGAGSYVGGNIGNAVGGSTNIADALETGLGPDLGSAVGQGLGGSIMNLGIGGIAGSLAGGTLANSFAPQGLGKRAGTYPFVPQYAAGMAAPKSINSMSGLTSGQQATGLATQGVYGGGLGPQEQSYYGNLLNHQLINPSGQVSPLSSLPSIEQSYNSKLFGNVPDSTSLLKELSTWNPSA